MDWYNAYREAKNKYKVKVDDSMYQRYIEDVVSTMFEWDERIFRPELFDRILRDCGMGALIKTSVSDYTPVFFTPLDLGNGWMPDGTFKDCVCFDFMGKEYKFMNWLENDEILVFFNNFMRTPDLFVEKYATFLSDVDFSILNNVFYSRQHPIPVARDKTTVARINEAIKTISEGQFNSILMESSIKDIIDGKEIDTLNITDVEKSKYLQYLSHLHDSLISRLFFMLGLGTTDNGKQAQITVDELNKNDSASITQATAWYNERKKGIDAAKKKGHNLSFDFSEIWKSRIELVMQQNVELITQEEGTENGGNNSDSSNSSEQ